MLFSLVTEIQRKVSFTPLKIIANNQSYERQLSHRGESSQPLDDLLPKLGVARNMSPTKTLKSKGALIPESPFKGFIK